MLITNRHVYYQRQGQNEIDTEKETGERALKIPIGAKKAKHQITFNQFQLGQLPFGIKIGSRKGRTI